MSSKKKKTLLIILIPLIILIICAVLLILYITTDFLKSDQTLFLKYLSQNMDAVKIVVDNTSEKEYSNLQKQNKYEANSELSATYTENKNTSQENKKNDINKLKVKTTTQSEYMNNYMYKTIDVLLNDADLFKTEYLHDGEVYGLRFPQEFGQFLAVENHDLKQVATDSGLTEDQIELIPNSIEEIDINSILTLTDEEIAKLQEKYINIISDNISKESYSKQKNTLITVNENGIYTNAYSVTITQEQANAVYLKILEALKNDEIILNKISQIEPFITVFNKIKNAQNTSNNSYLKDLYIEKIEDKIEKIEQNNMGTSTVKYTVYEANGNTIRTQITEEAKQTTIEFNTIDGGIQVNIEHEISNEEQENKKKIKIEKTLNDEGSTFSIQNDIIHGNEVSKIQFERNLNINSNNPTAETKLNYNDGKDNELELNYNESVNLNQEFERKIQMDKKNVVILQEYDEQIKLKCVNMVKEYLNRVLQENQALITNLKKVKLIR